MTANSATSISEPDKIRDMASYASRPYLEVDRPDWIRAIVFLLSLAMMGLSFPLGYLLVPVLLIDSFRKNRYDFVIQWTMLCGGYAIISENNLPFKLEDVAMILSVIGLFIYRKPPLVRKIVGAFLLYAASLLILAMFSDERMMVQIRVLRPWLAFVYFIIPLMVFSGQEFDMHQFMRKAAVYALILCAFYVIDGFVLGGHILIPNSFQTNYYGERVYSTWTNPFIIGFGAFPRKYPPGLFLLTLIVLPLGRYYKLRWYQWLLIGGALMASKTFTMIMAFVIGYMAFMPNIGRKMQYALIGVILLGGGYAVDSALPVTDNGESTLRIKSSVDQLTALDEAQDEEDISKAGSGRIGQAIPKFELMYHYNKQWTGLGFLHPEYTTNTKYIIINEFYSDIERNEEVATGIEIIPLQVMLSVGYIGLVIHLLFYISLYVMIRRLKYSIYFLSVEVCVFILGIGGFSGWIGPMGLFLMALAFSAVLLANRDTVWGDEAKKLSQKQ